MEWQLFKADVVYSAVQICGGEILHVANKDKQNLIAWWNQEVNCYSSK